MATALPRRGSLVGRRSGEPAPRSRMRPDEKGPMPGNSSSSANASCSGRDLRYAASSFCSAASRPRRRRYSTLRAVSPGKASSVFSFCGPGKACCLTPWISTVGPSSSGHAVLDPGRLHDPDALSDERPRRCLVRRKEANGPQARVPRLKLCHHGVPLARPRGTRCRPRPARVCAPPAS